MGGRLKVRVVTRWIVPMLAGVCAGICALPQDTAKEAKLKSASQTAEISRFYIEKPQKDSGYETGPLHIFMATEPKS